MAFSGASGIWAMRVGDFDAKNFTGSEAGLIDALAHCSAVDGGHVIVGAADYAISSQITVPANTRLSLGRGTYTFSGSGSFLLPNRSVLSGKGETATILKASASSSVTAIVANAVQDGTMQWCIVEGMQINGAKGLGAVVGAGVHLKGVYVGTVLRDINIIECSGYGLLIEGGTSSPGSGQLVLENVTVTRCDDDNILILSAVDGVMGYQVTSESVAAGKAQIHIKNTGVGSATHSHYFFGVHMEGTTACDGIWLDKASNCHFSGVTYDGTNANNVVKISGTGSGSDGAFGASGHTFRNVFGNFATIIDDQTAGVTVGNAQSRFVAFYSSPSAASGSINHQTIGLQAQMKGQDIAAASTIAPGNGNFFVVSGNTNIDNITTRSSDMGRMFIFKFTGTPSLIHNSGGTGNVRLLGSANVAMTANDFILMVSDGTLLWQIAPVVAI
jgi:hypothetical protein